MSILRSDEMPGRSRAQVITRWLYDWTRNTGNAADFSDCSESDVSRVAKDVGLSADELQRLVRRGPHAADLLLRRMASLNLDRAEVAEAEWATYLDLQRVCSNCDCKGRCKRDFAQRPGDDVWEEYCPNVATLKMLKASPWAARRQM